MESTLCSIIHKCKFITDNPHGLQKKLLTSYKQKYCNSCNFACAIYMVAEFSKFSVVPDNIFPNEGDKALEMIADLKP
ncbi:MAG: hypothetical protein GY714_25640 [Desulfobacterales bacterium]|nr:hypothetical protein [Desulfobacterales bacterium]